MVLVTPAPPSADLEGGADESKKITSIETAKKTGTDAERRLVEYFVIVSSIPQKIEENETQDNPGSERNVNATAPTDWKVNIAFEKGDEEYVGLYNMKPAITARYPVQDHRDNPLHENVTFFCHPSGGIRLCMEPNMPKVSVLYFFVILVGFSHFRMS